MIRELFRRQDFGYMSESYNAGVFSSKWIPDIHENQCDPTGKWKIVNKNGDSTLFLEIKNKGSRQYSVEKEVERRWFKFLGKKKIREWKSKVFDEPLWVQEDDLIWVETTVNECSHD